MPRFLPRRELGKTGFRATQLGIGDLADRAIPIETCVATLRRALDAGLNLVDTAPSYEDGYSEEIVARALHGRHDGIFIIDKIDHFDRSVTHQVAESLARLELPNIDLFVFHGISELDTWFQLREPGGAWDELAECVHAAKLRFKGISSHHPEVLRDAIVSGVCDVVMFPVGPFVDRRYIDEILPLSQKHNIGTIGFKVFGAGKLLGDTEGYGRPLSERPRGKLSSGGEDHDSHQLPRLSVAECLHYTLSCDPDVALLGMSFPNEQDAAFAALESFKKLDAQQMQSVRERAAIAMEGKGRVWWNPA